MRLTYSKVRSRYLQNVLVWIILNLLCLIWNQDYLFGFSNLDYNQFLSKVSDIIYFMKDISTQLKTQFGITGFMLNFDKYRLWFCSMS